MKKLQSLESFNASGLSRKYASKLVRGTSPNATPAGCIIIDNLERTNTDVMAFTNDERVEKGGINYKGSSDSMNIPTK